ncbi:MAG: YggU family protein [Deltaproteobacteria bacterium]|nr:YggU family protein [Deltaproteobacteria bacterium]MBW2047313.1 YggU family protein [Deltaproteobacteria bacterium]MBW2110017.1 YggU family protein [Deltaproteobacteria bacterium]MBW2353340.1 YggU family protein [Deltaproteobacteria bacterium]HDZ91799.1 YggU family protein [Deltaproteobacteria bacterium]
MEDNSWTIINVKVLPKASTTAILGQQGGIYRIKLTAPPTDGKANRALLKLLSKKLHIPKGDIEIISGERARIKVIRINHLAPERVSRLLSP